PEMRAFIVDNIRRELVNLLHQTVNVPELPNGPAQPGIPKGDEANRFLQLGGVWRDDLFRHDEQDVCMFGQHIDQANAVFAKVVRDEGNAETILWSHEAGV